MKKIIEIFISDGEEILGNAKHGVSPRLKIRSCDLDNQ
jgi:hypothetical protein